MFVQIARPMDGGTTEMGTVAEGFATSRLLEIRLGDAQFLGEQNAGMFVPWQSQTPPPIRSG